VLVVTAMKDVLADHSVITADAGYHSEENLKTLAAMEVEALIADNGMRQRDERFATQERHKAAPDPLYDKSNPEKKAAIYQPRDFTYDVAAKTCVCPAGKSLYGNGSHCLTNGLVSVRFRGAERDCVPCAHREQCLRTPAKSRTRQVAFFQGKAATTAESHTDRMKKRIDSPAGRARYGRRFATVEPVFANVRYNKGLDRFTLRGQAKVDAQWKLFCLVHNLEKLAHHGYAQ
jgi:IS5 family transposase